MAEILAITGDTKVAPEQQNAQRTSDNFPEILEKEKQKMIASAFGQINFQAFSSTDFTFSKNTDDMVNTLDMKSSSNNDMKQAWLTDDLHVEKNSSVEKNRTAQAASNDKAETKTENNRINSQAMNSMNRTIIGDLELPSQFFDTVISAKNRSSELMYVDVDDLISQIQDKIKFLKDGGKTMLSIELKPENLGTILCDITNKNGVISINIFADKQAKSALDQSISDLEKSLKLLNLNVASISIVSGENKRNNNGEYSS
jgi:flagellar hook-length control protein FliK